MQDSPTAFNQCVREGGSEPTRGGLWSGPTRCINGQPRHPCIGSSASVPSLFRKEKASQPGKREETIREGKKSTWEKEKGRKSAWEEKGGEKGNLGGED